MGKQEMYISSFKLTDKNDDGIVNAIFTIKGAEEYDENGNGNKDATADKWFKLVPDKDALAYLSQFMTRVGLEERVSLIRLEEQVESVKNRVFMGEIRESKEINPRTNEKYKNLYAKHPIDPTPSGSTGEVAKDSEVPF